MGKYIDSEPEGIVDEIIADAKERYEAIKENPPKPSQPNILGKEKVK